MIELLIFLTENSSTFNGVKAESDEIEILKKSIPNLEVLDCWVELIMKFKLIGIEIELDDLTDQSGIGGELQIMTLTETVEESTKFYPGIIAINKGYIPIGKCLEGSGDPYFLNFASGVMSVFRIPHDCLNSKDEFNTVVVEYINSLESTLKSVVS